VFHTNVAWEALVHNKSLNPNRVGGGTVKSGGNDCSIHSKLEYLETVLQQLNVVQWQRYFSRICSQLATNKSPTAGSTKPPIMPTSRRGIVFPTDSNRAPPPLYAATIEEDCSSSGESDDVFTAEGSNSSCKDDTGLGSFDRYSSRGCVKSFRSGNERFIQNVHHHLKKRSSKHGHRSSVGICQSAEEHGTHNIVNPSYPPANRSRTSTNPNQKSNSVEAFL